MKKKIALMSGRAQLVPKPQKCAKRRKKASKGAKRRLHGGKRRTHGAKMRRLTPFGAFLRILANWEKT
jgi:hypothetical protein